MRVFILKFDGTVEVINSYSEHAHYVNVNYPKGQLFREKLIGSMGYVWYALHRDYKGIGPAWAASETKYVPEAVRFARMLVE